MASRYPPALHYANSLNFTAPKYKAVSHVIIALEACGSWRRNKVWNMCRQKLACGKSFSQQMCKIENGRVSSHWCLVRNKIVSCKKYIQIWYMQLQMYQTFPCLKVIVTNRIYQNSCICRAPNYTRITNSRHICNSLHVKETRQTCLNLWNVTNNWC